MPILTLAGGSVVTAVPLVFTNSADVNVMRQYSFAGALLVPHTTSSSPGGLVNRDYPNDGSGYNVETGAWASGNTVTQTFTLGQSISVASFLAEWDSGGQRAPTSFQLRGSTDNFVSSDFSLITSNPNGSASTSGSFTGTTVNAVRYIATGPSMPGGDRFGLSEFQVYATTGQSISIDTGYNYLYDKKAAGKATLVYSSSTGKWAQPNGGTAVSLADDLYQTGDLKAQGTNGNPSATRAYVLISLDAATPTTYWNLGTTKDQGMINWEIYSTNNSSIAATAALNVLPDVTALGLQTAGWTLQGDQNSGTGGNGSPARFAQLNQARQWQYFLLAWNIQNGTLSELELFSVPEPSAIGVASLAAAWLVRRRRK